MRNLIACVLVSALSVVTVRSAAAQDLPLFVRGDTNLDGRVDISDPILTLGVLFLGDASPGCDDAMDGDDSGIVDLSDSVYVLNFLFQGGAPIPAPFPDCGIDLTADAIGCDTSPESCAAPCFDNAALNALIAESVPEVICVAADSATITVEDFEVEIVPGDLADPDCDGEGNPGSPIELDSVVGEIDRDAREIRAAISGSVEGLPIRVTSALLGQTDCTLIVPEFSATAVIPFVAEEDENGNLVVQEVLEGHLEDVEVDLEAEGGLVCSLFAALQDAFIEDLIAELEVAANEALAEVRAQVVGQSICPVP